MVVPFFKYQGTGNDFIIIDNRQSIFDPANYDAIKNLCDRRFGIGADGLMLVENEPGYDFKMLYYNADGKPGSMCGNGGRCIMQYAQHAGIINDKARFLAPDGLHHGMIDSYGDVHISMQDVSYIEEGKDYYYLNTGSPHYVMFVDDLYGFPVYEQGRAIRYSNRFKEEGTNVNFVQHIDGMLHVRTYERGVEDETYSCGTGVTAVAIVASLNGIQSPVTIQTKGGRLKVRYSKTQTAWHDVYLIGPAVKVFEGIVTL
ncbi:MAG: diaminopimelate epimerase [Cytophagaceae bacterium]|nr:diaminopimelate epimerase [Cytophagaceae bacterium]MDW8456171.1 diaminopimelate epimerase [Cytophagaceae bacterium]